jgi:AraC family transcriptional regulator, transcriptional activator FtrA
MASDAPRSGRAPRRHRVVSVLVDGMNWFEPSVASEFFGIDRSQDLGVPWYRHTFCTEHPGRVDMFGGLPVLVDDGLDALRRADTVVIPGWSTARDRPSPALVDALRRAHARGARIVSFCTGAFVLAHAGLLDDRSATTHWARTDLFAERFPDVRVDPSVLYVDNGDVITSAGSAASIDLALHLIRHDHGAEIANLVARDMVVPPHRDGGQAQFIEQPVARCPETDAIAEVLDWALAHLDQPLDVDTLAATATMSPRTFARRFRAATGTTPQRWVTQQRVAAAQRLLESTDLSVDAIAADCGFGTTASLRLHFQRQLGTSPQAYRRTFGAVAASLPVSR